MERHNKIKTPVARWIIAFILVIIFGGIYYLVYTGYSANIDDPIMNFFIDIRAEWLTTFFKGVTFLANPLTLIVLCGILIIFPKTTLRFGIPLALVTGLGALAHKGLKQLIQRDRPDSMLSIIQDNGFQLNLIEETGYSFPSGHANAGFLFFMFLAFLIYRFMERKKNGDVAILITVLLAIVVFLIGASRIYLGVHYPTDIIAGWCLGGFLLIIFISIYDAAYPLKYHLGDQPSDWSSDIIPVWKRPTSAK